jgi:outer membrane protein insertion porin family
VYGGYLVFSAGVFTLTGSRAERTERRAAGELVAPIGLNADFGLKLDTSIGTFDISVGNVLRRVPL